MIDPARGPFLFETSAEGWLARNEHPAIANWVNSYLSLHSFTVSAITVLERIRGYGLLWHESDPGRRKQIELLRDDYMHTLGRVLPFDATTALIAGEIMAALPAPPTAPRRAHRFVESRLERLARWRFDCMIAATALVANLPLIHNNAADFEPIRSAIELAPGRFPTLGPLELIRCTSLL